MKDERRGTWHFYLLGVFGFLGLLFLVDMVLEGMVAEYFQKSILYNRSSVQYLGMERTQGIFYWPKLRDILLLMGIGCFVLIEVVAYMVARYTEHKTRNRVIEQMEDRIACYAKGQLPDEKGHTSIDTHIQAIIQENKAMKQEMLAEMGKKNDLVTYLAHDLKTPLTSMIGYLSILEESQVPEDIRKDYIKKLLDKAYRLEDLTNQFFDIARFSLVEIPLQKKELDGSFLLEQLTEELYPLFQKKGLTVHIDLPDDMVIYGDGSLLARVMNNLLKNAIAYSYEQSTIALRGTVEEDYVELIIDNEGDTLSQQELDRIFDKFYRRDQSRSQSAGAGLGLAIAREIVERHGGTLEARSSQGHIQFLVKIPRRD